MIDTAGTVSERQSIWFDGVIQAVSNTLLPITRYHAYGDHMGLVHSTARTLTGYRLPDKLIPTQSKIGIPYIKNAAFNHSVPGRL